MVNGLSTGTRRCSGISPLRSPLPLLLLLPSTLGLEVGVAVPLAGSAGTATLTSANSGMYFDTGSLGLISPSYEPTNEHHDTADPHKPRHHRCLWYNYLEHAPGREVEYLDAAESQ